MEAIVIVAIIMAYMKVMTRCVPINNGFSVKFSPTSREDNIAKFRVLFATLPQELAPPPSPGPRALDNIFHTQTPMLRPGCSNQIAKMLFPLKTGYNDDNSSSQVHQRFINLPIVAQPYADYKVLVATAPPQMRLNREESEPIVIYVVFTEDDTDDTSTKEIKMPTIYFVSKKNGEIDLEKKEKADPIFIVDSNRTVTGLKSNDVAKFVKFKSKFLDRVDRVDDEMTTKATNSST